MYYPINKIVTDLFTAGNEFAVAATLRPYKGYYFSTFDGKYFTGNKSAANSVELMKYTVNKSTTSNQQLSFYSPTPSEDDYKKGFIKRYFIKRVNAGIDTIKEISKADYEKNKKNILYIFTQLDWKITGPLYDIPGHISVSGIIDTNKRTVIKKEKELPGINFYIKNLSQFSRIIL